MQVQRHQGETFLLDLADQAFDFFLFHHQLFCPVGFGADVGRCAAQGVDSAADQRQLAVADGHVAVGELHLARAYRFDFPALQHHTGFIAFFDVIVVARPAVFRDNFAFVFSNDGFVRGFRTDFGLGFGDEFFCGGHKG